MASSFGGNSNVTPLRRVAMCKPGPAIGGADPVAWHYGPGFNPAKLNDNHQQLVDIIEAAGAEINWLDDAIVSASGLADAVFTYDPSFVTDAGAILMNMGKALRKPEALAHRALYESLDIPILGTIEAPGSVEGGDCFWLDPETLAVGRGFRTNQAGIDQLANLLAPSGVRVLAYDLPYGDGPDACLHLLSLVSPLSDSLALIYAPLLPTALYQELKQRGMTLVEAPRNEFEASNGLCLNVLALEPNHGVMLSGFDQTTRRLRDAGATIETFDGDALCIPCEGGPTCLTRPLLRH